MSQRVIRNAQTGDVVLSRATWCVSFWCKLRGLQFTFELDDDEGLLFVNNRENRAETAIHMLFMFMDIAVVWLDAAGTVVDKQYAKPWRLAYVPQAPAKYYIEAAPALLERIEIGDTLVFDEEVA